VQLRGATALTSEAYVSQEGWKQARLDACPVHGTSGCNLRRLGTYGRATPVGMRVARFYCAQAHMTFSLLPDCLAAKLPGDLDAVERVVATVETSRSVEAAAEQLRPDIELASAVRWVRRRLGPVRAALKATVTMIPILLGVSQPTIGDVGRHLGTPVLRRIRGESEKYLGTISVPVGFGPRPRRVGQRRTGVEHNLGPDPPS
jgi:hypothetical protein